MTIKRLLEICFERNQIDIESMAMVEFGAGSLGSIFSLPIIDVKEFIVDTKKLINFHKRNNEKMRIVAVIVSDYKEDISNGLTIKEILKRIKKIDILLNLYVMEKGEDYQGHKIIQFIGDVVDGTNNMECERRNVLLDYNRRITDFVAL